MKSAKALLPLTLGLLIVGQRAPAEEAAEPDSIVSHPARVYARSGLERAANVPGRLIYLPFQILGFGVRQTATLMWDDRIFYRARELLTFADGRIGVRPLASSLRGTGARVFVKDVAGDIDADITTTLGASVRKRQHHLLSLAGSGSRTFSIYSRSEPAESFYGIGYDTRESDRSSFRQKDIYLKLTSRRHVSDRVSFDWDLNYHGTDIADGKSKSVPSTKDVYAPGTLPGLDDKASLIEAGLTLRGVFVDVPGSPTSGNRTRLRVAYRQSIDGDSFTHLQVSLFSEQFAELFYRRTASLKLGADWRVAPFDNEVPFYDLASLGGTEVLRGFKRGRFRDKGVGYAAGTYNFPVWQLIEGTLFYESGRAFGDIGDISMSDWASSYGGGVRMWVPEGVVLELLVARSSELTRMLFTFSTTF